MYISEIKLENFRGFQETKSINFVEGTNVIIGHNNAGKTSVLNALELLFGNNKNKRLSIDDFNKNISIDELKENPPKITVSAKFVESENDEKYSNDLATVSTWLTTIETPYEALITYEFFLPQKEEEEYKKIIKSIDSADKNVYWYQIESNFLRKYIYKVYVGNPAHKNVVEPEKINQFDFQFLTAIRDVERDLFTGRSSLLKEVIDFFMDYNIKNDKTMEDYEKKNKIRENKDKFSHNAKLLIDSLHERMKDGKEEMLKYAEETGASFDKLKPSFEGEILDTELYSALKLVVENESGIKLPAVRNGLGYNNLIYISLLLAKMQKDASGDYLGSNAKTYSILAIEEPEAHLHPNMQYKFLKFLNKNQKNKVRQTFVTSHSPNITAAVDLNNIIILYKNNNDINVAYPGRVFTDSKEDIKSKNYVQRFLDVTKADMFFAKSLILVEGISEQLLVPEFAKILDKDLTDSHVSIINIGGRYFDHFLKLFNPSNKYAIKKKVVCVTDLDPLKKEKNHAKSKKCFPFELIPNNPDYEVCSNDLVDKYSPSGDEDFIRVYSQEKWKGKTFEYDLILSNPCTKELITDSVSNAKEISAMMDSLKKGNSLDHILSLIVNPNFKKKINLPIKNCDFDDDQKCKHVIAARYLNSVQKGTVAQELAFLISENHEKKLKDENHFKFNIPSYIEEAIKWISLEQPP